MKFLSNFAPFPILVVAVLSNPVTRRDVNVDLVPQFGFQAGLNPTGTSCLMSVSMGSDMSLDGLIGTGDCDGAVNGANGQPIKIPCSCPPDRQTFINVSIHCALPSILVWTGGSPEVIVIHLVL
jgi:hypothetical protein